MTTVLIIIAPEQFSEKELFTIKYDGVVFICGRGSATLFTNDDALRIVAEMAQTKRIAAAICLAPKILANAGVLANRRPTVAKTEVKTLQSEYVKYTGPGVMVDGNIITASGPGYSKKLAKAINARLELTKLLGGSEA